MCYIQPLDLKLLVLVMELLAAQKGELDNANSRQKWSDKVRTVRPVVQQLLDSVSVQKYAELVNKCRYLLFYLVYSACVHSVIETVRLNYHSHYHNRLTFGLDLLQCVGYYCGSQVPGSGSASRRSRAFISFPLHLDCNVGPSAIPCEIPVVTLYLTRICEIS